MLLPRDKKVEVFRALFQHGALFYAQGYGFEDNTIRNKYLLVMRGLGVDGECYFYLPTSRVDQYRNNPTFQDSLFVFPKGAIPEFDLETAIVITSPHRSRFEKLENRYLEEKDGRRLDYCSFVPPEHMARIRELVRNSTRLSPFYKRQLAPQSIQY